MLDRRTFLASTSALTLLTLTGAAQPPATAAAPNSRDGELDALLSGCSMRT